MADYNCRVVNSFNKEPQDSPPIEGYATTNWAETKDALMATVESYLQIFGISIPLALMAGFLGNQIDQSDKLVDAVFPLLGGLSSLLAAVALCAWQGVPKESWVRRLFSSTLLGASVGICFYGICWSFQPELSYFMLCSLLGFLSAVPVFVGFGLAGGESRPPGTAEAKVLAFGLVCALGSGALSALEDAQSSTIPGYVSGFALFILLTGGRIDLARLWMRFEDHLIESRRR